MEIRQPLLDTEEGLSAHVPIGETERNGRGLERTLDEIGFGMSDMTALNELRRSCPLDRCISMAATGMILCLPDIRTTLIHFLPGALRIRVDVRQCNPAMRCHYLASRAGPLRFEFDRGVSPISLDHGEFLPKASR